MSRTRRKLTPLFFLFLLALLVLPGLASYHDSNNVAWFMAKGEGILNPTPSWEPQGRRLTLTICDATTLSIPDGPDGTVASDITINTTNLTVEDVNVSMHITHTNVGDLVATLTSPSGAMVELFSNVGGDGDDFGTTCNGGGPGPDFILDDQADTNVADGTAPFVGTFTTESGMALDMLTGEGVQGTWTLTITDDTAGETGALNCWCLIFTRTFQGGGPQASPN